MADQKGFFITDDPADNPLARGNPGIDRNIVTKTEPRSKFKVFLTGKKDGNRIGVKDIAYNLGKIFETRIALHCHSTKKIPLILLKYRDEPCRHVLEGTQPVQPIPWIPCQRRGCPNKN
jgi:hypothetical protein